MSLTDQEFTNQFKKVGTVRVIDNVEFEWWKNDDRNIALRSKDGRIRIQNKHTWGGYHCAVDGCWIMSPSKGWPRKTRRFKSQENAVRAALKIIYGETKCLPKTKKS